MANKNNISKVDSLNKEIDKQLYDFQPKDKQNRMDIQRIQDKISQLNMSYGEFTKTPDLLEFLTQNSLTNLDRLQTNINRTGKMNKDDYKKSINSIMENGSAQMLFQAERERINRYADYRIIDGYIPQVSRCIDLIANCIISPDDITKDSFAVTYPSTDKSIEERFDKNVKDLKKKIKFDSNASQWIRDGAVDGDVFVAVLKLDDEINSMLLREASNDVLPIIENEKNILSEEELFNNISDSDLSSVFLENYASEELLTKNNVNLKDAKKSREDLLKQIKKTITSKLNNNTVCIDTPYGDMKNFIDGSREKLTTNMNGCLIKTLAPENVVKLDLDSGVTMGYLYIEKYDPSSEFGSEGFGLGMKDLINGSAGGGDSYISGTSNGENMSNSINQSGNSSLDYFDSFKNDKQTNTIVKDKFLTDLFVAGISKKLDKGMIEKNQQFREVIYHLIRKDYLLDKKVKIIFYEAEDIVHYKPNSNSTYGISKLAKILFYAKIFLATLLTQTMQKISRGRDKRIIYVEAGLDEDLEDVVQSVVRDFKAKEIQSDTLKSISTIMRRVGAFEDYYLPKIDGESPVDFESISGMDVNVDDEFNQFLLKSIISGMGIPSTYIDSSNEVDFSRSLVMQNSTFVHDIVTYQSVAQPFLSEVFRKAYNYEYYDEILSNIPKKDTKKNTVVKPSEIHTMNIDIELISISLPSPQYLNIVNINEQIQNHQNKIEFVTNTYYPEGQEGKEIEKAEFKKVYTKHLITNIDWEDCDKMIAEIKLKLSKEDIEKKANKIDDGSSEEDMGSDDDMDMDL